MPIPRRNVLYGTWYFGVFRRENTQKQSKYAARRNATRRLRYREIGIASHEDDALCGIFTITSYADVPHSG